MGRYSIISSEPIKSSRFAKDLDLWETGWPLSARLWLSVPSSERGGASSLEKLQPCACINEAREMGHEPSVPLLQDAAVMACTAKCCCASVCRACSCARLFIATLTMLLATGSLLRAAGMSSSKSVLIALLHAAGHARSAAVCVYAHAGNGRQFYYRAVAASTTISRGKWHLDTSSISNETHASLQQVWGMHPQFWPGAMQVPIKRTLHRLGLHSPHQRAFGERQFVVREVEGARRQGPQAKPAPARDVHPAP